LRRLIAHYRIAHGEPDKAIEIYEKLIASGDATPVIYSDYSEVLLAEGQRERGAKALRDGLRRFSDNAYLHLRLGTYLAALQRYDDALPELRSAADLAPNDPSVLRAYSLLQSRMGDTKGALESAAKLYAVSPTRPEAMVFYAVMLEANEQTKDAEALYRKGIAADSNNVIALNNLAMLLTNRDDLKEAEQFARRAVGAAKGNGGVMDTLGWVLYRQGRIDEALKTLTRASEAEPGVAVIHYHKGVVLSEAGRHDEAHRELSSALEIDANAEWADDARTRLGG
jgi:Flp pilus assembly protein TadD